jgi:hypothetical protein
MRTSALPLLILASLPIGGCAPMIAAKAVGAAVRAADGSERVPTEDPGPAARAACTTEAAKHGTDVRVIDIEYRSAAKLIVWGSVQSAGGRRSFECRYEGKIAEFKLRAI